MDEVQLVVVVGAAERADENVAAVFADRRVDDPGRMILALIDQDVVGLRRADAVVIDRLVGQRRFEDLARRRLGIPRIEEALRVVRPRQIREAHPGDHVAQVLAGRDVADAQRLPVGAAFRDRVDDEPRIR